MDLGDPGDDWDWTRAGDVLESRKRIVQLDRDHPGFRDPEYRARRDAIAQIALAHRGGPIPEAEYTAEEHGVWRHIWERLDPLHERAACAELLETSRHLALDRACIPQLETVSARLTAATGFRLAPVAGLVHPRVFLNHLGDGVFLSTQYIRHHSAPLYTPEPDVVHELVGHGATLLHPGIAAVSRRFGALSQGADEALLCALTRVYWYTLEFGLVAEGGDIKAFGAGVLSSVGEMERYPRSPHRGWDLDEMARTDFDPTDYQPFYFVGPSFEQMLADLDAWMCARAPVTVGRRPPPPG